LATFFGSSEPSLGQFLVYGHGAFSECAHYGIPYYLQTIFILKFKSRIYWSIYILKYMWKIPCSHSLNAPCPYTKNWPKDGSLEPKNVAN